MAVEKLIQIGLDEYQGRQLEDPASTLEAIQGKAMEVVGPTLNQMIETELMHEQCRGKLDITIQIARSSLQPDAETVSPPG